MVLLASLFSLTSCNDYLSEVPDSRIELDNIDKVAELLTNAYPECSYLFLETLTDNVAAAPTNRVTPTSEELFCWKNVSTITQDSPAFYWNYAYNGIAHANQALVALEKLSGDEDRIKAIKGEALLIRAYCHFMLVNIFAKHYDVATASTDLGVPYTTEPEKTLIAKYKRETVARNYEQVEKDMLEGMSLISNKYYKNSGKYQFTREAALAFASRFYLYKKDYANCLMYSNQLLGSVYNPIYIKDYQKVLAGQGPKGRAQVFSSASDASNLLLMRKSVMYQLKFYVGYRLTNKIADKLYSYDARSRNMWAVNNDQVVVYQAKFQDLMEGASSSGSGMPYTVQTIFRGEEVLFNKLESMWEIGSLETDAVKQAALDKEMFDLLNPFLVERYNGKAGSDYISGTIESYKNMYYKGLTPKDRDVFKRIMLDERRREFCEEGLRWFDIKRLGIEVEHVNLAGEKYVLKANDSRKVIQIPVSAISNGLVKNEIEESTPVNN